MIKSCSLIVTLQSDIPLCLFILSLISCSGDDNQQALNNISNKQLNDTLVRANQTFIETEKARIDAYISRRQLQMQETGTGLRYFIINRTDGVQATDGKRALVNFKVSLLDGTECYSSEKKGPQEFLIGQDNVESGLHEGIKLMRVGEKAKFIMPSHLAHGLIGDEKKIPPRSVIIYDIELIRLR